MHLANADLSDETKAIRFFVERRNDELDTFQ